VTILLLQYRVVCSWPPPPHTVDLEDKRSLSFFLMLQFQMLKENDIHSLGLDLDDSN
jgi:hypothetical protein